MKKIILTFENDGKTVHKKVEGFDGQGCINATDFINKALGATTKTEYTNDFYVPEPVGLDQQAKQFI